MILSNNFMNAPLELDISVITLEDNINHTYCAKIKWEKDNRTPIGVAELIMPYDKKIESYWSKYSGIVVIHGHLNSKKNQDIQSLIYNLPQTISLNLKAQQNNKNIIQKEDKEKNKIHLQNDKYNYSYIGKVSRFKQVGKTFIVYLEDLGWKFLQKVPKEFRNSYIAGQSLDDAFQAICEFMGVDFAYSIEDLSQYNFSADGYSIEKNNQIIENTPSILKEWGKDNSQEEDNNIDENIDNNIGNNIDKSTIKALNDKTFENSGLIELENNKNKQNTNESQEQALNSQITNNLVNNDTTNPTNTNNKKEKIEQYQQEFDEKIKDLFIGNSLYNSDISNPVLNYDWITIEPKSITSENISTVGGVSGSSNPNNEENQNESNSEYDSTFGNTSSRAREKNGWINGQYYINGKIYLSKEYLNSLSPSEAWDKYLSGQGVYTDATLTKLHARAYWQPIK